ncbi:MAG: DUF86 domain-containing protein [bacterium]|nr:DUF86 domain-containing protein [bacterium]
MVDQVLLERFLTDIRANVRELREANDITWEVYQTNTRARRFVERTLHILIEACIDVAHHIIADEQFREPTNYRDAFTVLAENRILHSDDLETFRNMASFRNLLVHYYERIDDAIVYGILTRHLVDFDLFVERITSYLQEKCGTKQDEEV